jgi:acyl transferase domain-containing protein/acyl carrier protein
MNMTGDNAQDGKLSPVKRALLAVQDLQAQLEAAKQTNEPVAIVGMGCRYPGAQGLEEFWRVLCEGIDTVTEVPAQRWCAESFSMSGKGGFLGNVEEFDAAFFGISPREAPHVDPRQRVALEVAWEALEHAGIPPDTLAGTRTSVFLATLTNDYDHLLFNDLERVDAYSGAGTANSIVANRISYFLDLRGPSMALDTACSGSLVAIQLACDSLRKGESSLALAGGVNLNLMPKSSVFFDRAGALAEDGRCKTFDERADGIVRSDGAGIIVLKLLSEARKAGDPVIALVRGGAVNHGGRSNGIMAPNGAAQRAVLVEAYRRAGVSPSAVQMIEAHGTGTKLGDPIEVAALGDVLARDRPAGHSCSLGSLKTNVGHSEAASGVAGVIKAALALKHRLIPPTLHFQNPNPLIPFEKLPFKVQTVLGPWPDESVPLVAGVSGFGFGGTNAHLVLEEASVEEPVAQTGPPYILPISARTPEALGMLVAAYRDRLQDNGDVGGFCYSAGARRTHHVLRMAAVGQTKEDLIRELESWRAGSPEEKGPLAFVFSGQGSHWPAMGRALYERYPVYRKTIDECERLLGREVTGSPLNCTTLTQPAIFAVQTALGALWRSWGIVPDFVVGHSLGEVAAAHFAGALSLEDAVQVVHHRSRLMKTVEGKGKTAVVGLTWVEAREAIAGYPDLSVAGSNSPLSTVIAGTADSLAEVMRQLEARSVFCSLVPGVEIAFHSQQMDGLAEDLVIALRSIKARKASVPILSTVTGALVDGGDLDARYWARNLRQPFLFTQATQRLLEMGCTTLIEVSPHPVLGSAMRQTTGQSGVSILHSLRRGASEVTTMFGSLRSLYQMGWDANWRGVYPASSRSVTLPSYPWQRQRYWLDQLAASANGAARKAGKHPLLGERIDAAGGEGLHIWEIDFDPQHPRYLADHRVLGQVALPGSVWVEMALRAARDVFGTDEIAVRDLKFESALKLAANERKRVQLVFTVHGESADFALYSRSGNAEAWSRHAVGTCGVGASPHDLPENLEVIRGRCAREKAPDAHYASMLASGLEYGPAFQVLHRIWAGDGEAMAEIRPPASLHAQSFICHPILLDAALHVVAAAMPANRDSYLPHQVGEWQVFEPSLSGPGPFHCHARLRGQPGGDILEADVHLMDALGRMVARLDRLALKRLAAAPAKVQSLTSCLLEQQWQQLSRPQRTVEIGRWLVLSDRTGVGEQLARRLKDHGCEVTLAFAGAAIEPLVAGSLFQGVIHLWSLDGDSQGCISALRLTQAMLASSPSRLWLMTRGAQPVVAGPLAVEQAPIAGLSLVIGQEHPQLQCCLLDLDPDADADDTAALVDELLHPASEARIGWRNGVRYVARIVPVSATLAAPAVRADLTYLITGGLGALGLLTAKSLVNLGARSLVLTGRSGLKGKEAAVAQLTALGAKVTVAAVDISCPEQTARLFMETLAGLPALAGVIHAAGVLDDGMILQQSAERFAKVMAPKVAGAWNLHVQTRDLPLDFFLMYSSAASLVGSPGQSNYASANAYLDALAHHRRALGLPGLSINWGAWDEEGMAANAQVHDRMAAHGVSAIDPQEGAHLLMRLLDLKLPQIGVIPIDWSKFLRQFGRNIPPLFSALVPSGTAAGNTTFLDRFNATPLPDKESTLRRYLREELARVLRFEPGSVTARERFFDVGMDSLTALEFRNRLEADLETALPATLAFDYPSLEALGNHLAESLLPPAIKPEVRQPGIGIGAYASELAALSTEDLAGLLANVLADNEPVAPAVQHAG